MRRQQRRKAYRVTSLLLLSAVVFALWWSAGQVPAHAAAANSASEWQQNSHNTPQQDSIISQSNGEPSQKSSKNRAKKKRKQSDGKIVNGNHISHGNIELPSYLKNDSLIFNQKGRYTLQYSSHYRSALWVAYKLTKCDIEGGAKRSSNFRQDRELSKLGFAISQNSDYRHTPYDRGHLVPSADRVGSREENRETFLLSNSSPQLPELNRGTWKSLEEALRRLTSYYDTLYIVTGAILKNELPRLGRNEVAIPQRFFKAVMARRHDKFESFVYIMPNSKDIKANREEYIVPLDSLESLLGVSLFPAIKNYKQH